MENEPEGAVVAHDVPNPLTEIDFEQLQQLVDPLGYDENFAIDKYRQAIEFTMEHI